MGNNSGKPMVLLRGDQLKTTPGGREASPVPVSRDAGMSTRTEGQSIYGVPVSAIQHCCGRGCKHCRIYWNRLKF
jgi:hypothetical protein